MSLVETLRLWILTPWAEEQQCWEQGVNKV